MGTRTKQPPQPSTHGRSLRRGPGPKASGRTSGGGARKGMMMAVLPVVGGLVARKMRGRNRSGV